LRGAVEIDALHYRRGFIGYATAKAGLAGLTSGLGRALAPAVRVNGIAPGYVNSNGECTFGDADAAARATVPLARDGHTEEYAAVIV
jgi:NAD(P)-dependent dehydrogenase (short-subunit alcohol dehydrogenase family)